MAADPSHVLSLDEGTTGVSGLVFDARGRLVAKAYKEIPQFFPRPGWVEHDAEAIWRASLAVLRGALSRAKIAAGDVAALGITNQRETIVPWDAKTGRPLAKAIVWQCRRTSSMCDGLRRDGVEPWVRERTGLLIDPYFSGSKIRWFVEENPRVQAARADGRLRFGTMDSWIIHKLSGGRAHVTDASNASRTLLMNLGKSAYDAELMGLFKARSDELPVIGDSSGTVAETDPKLLGKAVPIAGIAGDQQAALFGQACFAAGMTKNTYGTGCFALTNTGPERPKPPDGILATLAWRLKGRSTYALEGSVFIGGAVIQWLRDGLRFFKKSADSEAMAKTVANDGGVVLVPAFVGLGAPHWDPHARGAILGLTRGTTRAHIARAALESVALQSAEVVNLLVEGASAKLPVLRVDGGATGNSLLMQYQADVLDVPVERAVYAETTGLGAAYLAGLGVGVWRSLDEIGRLWKPGRRFTPARDGAWRAAEWKRWRAAVDRVRGWATAVT